MITLAHIYIAGGAFFAAAFVIGVLFGGRCRLLRPRREEKLFQIQFVIR